MYRGKIYVLNSWALKDIILGEMPNVSYDGHPGY
jgi:hypothetical protein